MLVLTRKNGEGINIGENIRIKVLEANKGHVRIGIEAPHELAVYREEVFLKILEENRTAADPDIKAVEGIFSSFKGFVISEESKGGD